jgi:hypothetical protein
LNLGFDYTCFKIIIKNHEKSGSEINMIESNEIERTRKNLQNSSLIESENSNIEMFQIRMSSKVKIVLLMIKLYWIYSVF